MQITIDTHELNAEQLTHLIAIIQSYQEAITSFTPMEQKAYQPEPPFGDAVIDTSLNEKPKRGRKPKEALEASETVEVVSEVVEQEIVTPDAVSVTHSDTKKLTLSDVKAKAQDLVQKVSRDAVKNTINKYADKISEVKESDYPALMADFEALEG